MKVNPEKRFGRNKLLNVLFYIFMPKLISFESGNLVKNILDTVNIIIGYIIVA